MKKWIITLSILLAMALLASFHVFRSSGRAPERLAVAAAFGQFQAFLLSQNYQSAYEMMASDFKRANSFAEFTARGQWSGMFTNCDWNLRAEVNFHDREAELRIKYNTSFGSIYYLVRENNGWRIRDKFAGFEE
jgi:hypothetical protein